MRTLAMNIVASKRVQSIGAYAFAAVDEKVAELKAKGITPIDFGVGDYAQPTPEIVREACKSAIDERAAYGYPAYVGDASYRSVVAEWTKKRFGVDLNPDTEVCSTIGSKEAVFNFHEGFVDPGDVVLVPSPGYPPYKRGTLFSEGEAVFFRMDPENNFAPDLSGISSDAAKRAKVMWINYPNSPTGAVLTREQMQTVVNFCHDNEIILAADEAYTELYYGDEPPLSILEITKEAVVSSFSLSKRSIMTGWRVGWMAGDERIISIFKKLKTNIDSGVPTFIQDAASAALKDETHVDDLRVETKKKRDILCAALKGAGLTDCTPQATLYVWQKTPDGISGIDFATKLVEEAHIVTTPGEWISDELADGSNPGAGYVRFALVPTIEECEKAATRIRELKL